MFVNGVVVVDKLRIECFDYLGVKSGASCC